MKQFLQLIRPFREMRKIVVLCLVMVMAMGAAWGQTTVTQTSFTALSGNVDNDTYVSYAAYKGGGTSNPAVNTNAIRLYQNSSGQTGGYVVIGVAEGYVITSATIQSTMTTTTGYLLTDVDPGSSTPAKSSFNVRDHSLSANTDYTVSGISTRYITFACFGTTSSTRLYLSKISVTYQSAGGNTLTATTTTINSTGITNTDVYVNTTAGSLSATVTPDGGSALANPTITWSSGNTDVATIDANGAVTLVSAGTTTITASYPGEENQYASSSATYELTVTSSAPYVQPTIIDANLNNSLFGTSYTGSASNITDENPVIGSLDNVTVTYAGSGNHYINDSQIRFYPNNKLTFDAPSGYEITDIVFTSAGNWAATISANTGNYTSDTKTWIGSATSVQFTGSGSGRCDMSKATITIVSLGNAVATTTTIDAAGITNTEVYTGTDAGFLSATVTVTEGGTAVPDASVTWSSSNNAVATIDAATGAITLVDAGSVTFTASYEGVEDEYLASSGTYEMTVTNSDPNAPGTVNNPYTVAQAIANTPSNGNVYIRGIVSSFYNTSITGDGSNYRYYISDDGTTSTELLVYRGKGLNQATFTNANDLLVGDEVVIYGSLITYQNTPEVAQDNYLYSWNRPAATVEAPVFDPVAGTYAEAQTVTISCETQGATIYYTTDGTEPTDASTEYTAALTISTATTVKAIAYVGSEASIVSTAIYHICSADNPYTVAQALDFDEYPANGIYVHGIVSTAPTSLNNGTLTYYISEDGEAEDELEIYKGKNLENTDFTAVGDIQVGDIVTIYGNVKIYNNFKEFDQGNYIVSFERPVPVLEPYDLTVSTLNEHINAIYVFDANNQNDPLIEEGLAGTVQVLEGTDIIVSPDVEAGYVLTALTVLDGEGESVQPENHMSEGGYYSFTMPSGPVTISATAVEYVPPTPGNWMLTNLSDLTEDDVFVIVGDNGDTYALSNDNGTQSAPTAVAVTVVEGTLSEEPAINLQWNLAITDDGYVFYPNGTTESWLYCTHTNNGVRVGTNTNNVFVLDDASDYLMNVATSRYIGVYNSQDWRCYTNTTGNISDQTFAFYKKVEPVEPVVYFFEGTGDCGTVSLTGSSITLPEATISCSDWAFAGWATAPVNETTTAPTLYTGTYAPTGDMFLYAIYQNNGTYNSFPACVYTQLDVTEGFESYTESHIPRTFVKPTGWTVVAQNVPARSKMGRPQVLYYTLCAHESDYCLFMDTLSVLAMPKLDNGISFNGLEMEFYLRQMFDYQYLEVGVMSDLADPESFELIETISNVGSAVNRRVVDFSGYHGEGRYIAFRNAYSGEHGQKSHNYLDDIVVRLNNSTCGITELPYTQNFDNLTGVTDLRTGIQPECWTEAQRYANYAAAYEPQLVYGAAYAHSGSYTLQLDGLCIYAMPELKVPNKSVQNMQLEFYVRQYSADCSLEVGVMSNLNDANSFVALETVSNDGVSGSQKHVVDFGQYAEDIPSGAKYIAFRNIYNGAWNRSPQNIDDINLIERVEDNCGITELPYTQDFDNLTDITDLRTGIQPECWTEAHRYANYAAAYEPQLIYGAAYAHSGYYTLQLDGQCIYAMPELKVPGKSVRDMQLEFYVRQYSANCLLEVGVMSNLNDANSFVALATVSNNGVSGSQKHVVDFGQYSDDIPSGTKYIAFRNIYNGAWNRSPQNIDDINLIERVEDNCGITELPYTQNFDNLTDITDLRTGIQPECWTEAHRYANYAAAYEPQLIYGAAYAHSGYYTLQLDGLCIYAMPELKVPDKSIQDMQLEFYVRQYSADCSLEVGVMSNLNDANSFVALDTVSNNGVSGSQKHVVDFSQYAENIPSGAKYIAFRNIYNGAWNRSPQNLDDITLSVPEAKIAEMSSENEIDAMGVERYLEGIKVYPNPTRGNLYIDAMDVQKVECYNQMGQLVGVYDNANELNIGDLSDGVYMFRITVPQGVTMRKVVKK